MACLTEQTAYSCQTLESNNKASVRNFCNCAVAQIPGKKTECVTKGVYMHKILSDIQNIIHDQKTNVTNERD